MGQLLLAALFLRSEPLFAFLAGGQSGSWGEWAAWSGVLLCVVGALLWSWRQPTQLLINRSLVYGMLTGFVVGICVVAVGLSSALLQRQESWLLSMLL